MSRAVKSDKSLGNDESVIVVDDRDSKNHKLLRHCFVLLAKETRSPDDKLVLKLSHGYSQGYYPTDGDKGRVSTEDFWLFDKKARDERTISCTAIIQEGDICKKNKNNTTTPISADDLKTLVWDTITLAMSDNAKENPVFSRWTHNCCVVAFESLRKVTSDSDYLLNLSNINKRSFNILGCGISFSVNDDTVSDCFRGTGRNCMAIARGLGRFSEEVAGSVIVVVSKVNELYDGKGETKPQHEEV